MKRKLLFAIVALLCSVGAWAQTDVTSYIISNPSFEIGTTIGWTVDSSNDTGARSTSNATYEMSNTVGDYLFNTWSQGIPIKQTLGILPAGSYTLSAIVGSNGATMYMIVNDDHSSSVVTSDAAVGVTLSHSFTLEAPTEVTIGVVGGAADGSYLEEGHWWYKCDNFTLTYSGDATTADFLAAKKAQLAKTAHTTSLLDAITSAENDNDAATAILAVEKSAYDYKTISTSDVFEYGATYNFWNKSTTNGEVAYNTWSGEGENDGSEMTTPFVQNWVANGTQLTGNSAEGNFYYTLNLNEGDKVKVSALVRVFNEATPAPTGASFFVGDSEVDIISEGSACTGDYSTKGIYGTFTATGVVGAEGTLDFGVKLAETSNVNWIAMKNVKAEILPTITLNQTDVSLVNGETVTLTASVTPSYANDRSYTWSSSDETVATVSNGVVTTHKAGTATIKATSNTDESIVASATIRVTNPVDAPSSYSTLGAGDFYIMNAATGTFLGGANWWGTQASVIEHGIPFTVALGDGVYTLDSHTYNGASKHFFDGTYIDGESTDLYITSLGSGRYSISTASGSSYLSANAANTGASNFAPNSNSKYAQWYFLSKSDLEDAFSNATPESPVDATFYIGDQNFSRNYIYSVYKNDKSTKYGSETYPWTITADNFDLKGGNSGNTGSGNFCAESFRKTFTLSQEMTVANGRYKLRAQAMERLDGSDPVSAVIYANNGTDEETASFNARKGSEDSMTDCSNQFTAGQYYTDWITIDVTGGTLTVGAKSTSSENWCVWDNFELYYCAPLADSDDYAALNTAISTAEGHTLGFEDGEYAPYENIARLEEIAVAKAIDQEASNTKETVYESINTLNNATWNVNVGDVECVYNGDFAIGQGTPAADIQKYGWTRTNGWGQFKNDAGEATSSGTAYYNQPGSLQYGNAGFYTMPLKGDQFYKLTFKYGYLDREATPTISVLNSSDGLAAVSFAKVTSSNSYQSSMISQTVYFKTGAAGDYILTMANDLNIVWSDVSLVKATSSEVTLSSGQPAVNTYYQTLTLDRTFSADKWNTLCVPFAFEKSVFEEVKVLNAITVTGDNISMAFADAGSTVEAGTPCLVKAKNNGDGLSFSNVSTTGSAVQESSATAGEYTVNYVGTYTEKSLNGTANSDAWIVNSNKLYHVASNVTVEPYRAYFTVTAPTPSSIKSLTIDGDATSVNAIDNGQLTIDNAAIYNLAGQKVKKATKGVYIVNGKKVLY